MLYFKNGQMFKVEGKDETHWYDADIIISDGVRYDLRDVDSIRKIKTPKFEFISGFEGYGATGSLDYVLRMKAGKYFDRKEKELCSALLWKSSELMLNNKWFAWRQRDYERLIRWHSELGMDSEAKKARQFLAKHEMIFIDVPKVENKSSGGKTQKISSSVQKDSEPKMTYQEKELLLVQRASINDMTELTDMPFVWNTDVKKFIQSGGHPFAYMDIVGDNVNIVKSELIKMNERISSDAKTYKHIPNNARIPVEDIVFTPSDLYGYTRIMCTPKTITGKISKYPLKIFFATDLSKSVTGGDTTHGELVYDKNGSVASANIYCWRKGNGFFLRYKTVNDELTLCGTERAGATL